MEHIPAYSLPPVSLVLGGARSGKSSHAEKLVSGTLFGASPQPAVYIATAEAGDVELGHRRGDHLDRATGEAEVERPNRVAVAPRVELLEAGKENTLAAEFVALGFGDGGWWRGDFLTQGAILRIPFKHRFQGCLRMETCEKGD